MIASTSGEMNNDRLEQVLRRVTESVDGSPGYWRLQLKDRELLAISDQSHNRMRIMSPVAETEQLDPETLQILLEANFDRALDAKYAISQNLLWAVFMHRLRELTEDQIEDGIHQVIRLADNFGTSYASTELIFGGGE